MDKVYNAEIAHPDLRGSLGAVLSSWYALGNFYTFVLGYFISSWRLIAWLLMINSGRVVAAPMGKSSNLSTKKVVDFMAATVQSLLGLN